MGNLDQAPHLAADGGEPMTLIGRRAFILQGTLAGLMGSSFPSLAKAQHTKSDLPSFVAPELRQYVIEMLKQGRIGTNVDARNLAVVRALRSDRPRTELTSPAWREVHVGGPAGTKLRLLVINENFEVEKPAVLHMHGGGFVLGKADQNLAALQQMAKTLDCVVVSVDYRLAPEVTWRSSVEDNYAGLKWVFDNSRKLGVDRARIAVMGESAGGGHAALLAQITYDRGEIPICFQCLVYPMLDDRTGTGTTPPYPIGEILWTAASNRFGWQSFLGQEPGTDSVPSNAVPARRPSLAGLPPAWIGVGAIDLFVGENIAYAERLINDGVPTQLLVLPGAFHGFDGIGKSTIVAQDFRKSKISALARAFKVELPTA